MIVIGYAAGYGAPPPPWMAVVAGIAFIVYAVYRVSKERRLSGVDYALAVALSRIWGWVALDGVNRLLNR